MKMTSLPVVITMGDPTGIGPEIIAQSITDPRLKRYGPFCIVGDRAILRKFCKRLPENYSFIHSSPKGRPSFSPGKPSPASGKASLLYLAKAITLIRNQKARSLATGPVSKELIALAHPGFQGHTEYLADAFNKRVEMMFVCGKFRMVIATRHIPLKEICAHISQKNIYKTICLVSQALTTHFKIKRPAIVISGLNPHAGEGGLLGEEEQTKIIPAIKKAQNDGIDIAGPFAADTLFSSQNRTKYDAFIAMYHDQGLGPIKTLFFNRLVNVTIGLPFIRTSPAHGTAYAIAGKGMANPSSMFESIKLAGRLHV